MKRVTCAGQFSFEESFADIASFSQTVATRLTTLAKEPKHRTYTDIAEKIFSLAYDEQEWVDDIFKKMARIVRSQLKSIQTEDPMDSKEYQELKKLTGSIDWKLCYYEQIADLKEAREKLGGLFGTKGVSLRQICKKKRFDAGEKMFYLWCPEVFPEQVLLGLKLGKSMVSNHWFKLHGYVKIVDMAYAISWLIIFETVRKNILAQDIQKTVRCQDILSKRPKTRLEGCRIILCGDSERSSRYLLQDALLRRNNTCLYLYHGEYVNLYRPDVYSFLQRAYSETELTDLMAYNTANREQCSVDDLLVMLKKHQAKKIITERPIIFLSCEDAWRYLLFDVLSGQALDGDTEALFRYIAEEAPSASHTAAIPVLSMPARSSGTPIRIFFYLFLATSAVMEREIRVIKEEQKEKSEHAKSFQTKKNIPAKTLAYMEKSSLHEFFTFVEYDADTDLAKVSIVENQILAFLETYFSDEKLSRVKLRFRKLGNHKAAGLYYPSFQTICVDIHFPSSFIHEFGHCMDYLHGELSNTLNSREFTKLYNRYIWLLDKKISRNKVSLKGKYDRTYYAKETEVFARSFELFFKYCVGLSNSLLKTDEEYRNPNRVEYHPEDEEYMGLVNEYFSRMFAIETTYETTVKEEERTA